ncbi:MAG: hypothetical protein QM769_13080 [Pseudoxanthomonas sp.]
MPEISTPAILAFVALVLSFIAAKPLANAGRGLPSFFAALASITLVASVVRLAFLIGWWTILAFFVAAILSALLMRPAYKPGGRGDMAIFVWTGYIVPLAIGLCIAAWVMGH